MKSKGRQYIPSITGEFLPEDEIRSLAREHFLHCVEMLAPELLYYLRDQVFPKFQAAFEFEIGRGGSRVDINDLSVVALLDVMFPEENADIRTLSAYQAFRESSLSIYVATEELVAWTKRFHLTGKRVRLTQSSSTTAANSARIDFLWPIIAGLETVLQWQFVHGRATETLGGIPLFRPRPFIAPQTVEDLKPIQLRTTLYDHRAHLAKEILDQFAPDSAPIADPRTANTPAWNLEWEPLPDFRTRVTRDFKDWLDRYIEERRRSARSAGLVKTPGKRELSHFVWTVKYQIMGESAAAIARDHKGSVTAHAVEKAVQGVLGLLRLQPRDPTPGRRTSPPPKQIPERFHTFAEALLRVLAQNARNS